MIEWDYKPANIQAMAEAIYNEQCRYVGANHEQQCITKILIPALQSFEDKIEAADKEIKKHKAIEVGAAETITKQRQEIERLREICAKAAMRWSDDLAGYQSDGLQQFRIDFGQESPQR